MGRIIFQVVGGPDSLPRGPLLANWSGGQKIDGVQTSLRRRLGYPQVVSRHEIQAGVWTIFLAWRRSGSTVRRGQVTVAIVG